MSKIFNSKIQYEWTREGFVFYEIPNLKWCNLLQYNSNLNIFIVNIPLRDANL